MLLPILLGHFFPDHQLCFHVHTSVFLPSIAYFGSVFPERWNFYNFVQKSGFVDIRHIGSSARNDGIDRTSVRNLAVSDKAIGNTQQHNEREKSSYRNPDIISQRTAWNVHFKKPFASYTGLFA